MPPQPQGTPARRVPVWAIGGVAAAAAGVIAFVAIGGGSKHADSGAAAASG